MLLQTVSTAFNFFKWLGAAYLIWLGIKMWRTSSEALEVSEKSIKRAWWGIFRNAFVTTSLNPKSIVFFLAFIPQFMEPEMPFISQALVLGGTFFVLAIMSVVAYASLASYAGQKLRLTSLRRWSQRLGGGLLIGAGGMTAVTS